MLFKTRTGLLIPLFLLNFKPPNKYDRNKIVKYTMQTKVPDRFIAIFFPTNRFRPEESTY